MGFNSKDGCSSVKIPALVEIEIQLTRVFRYFGHAVGCGVRQPAVKAFEI